MVVDKFTKLSKIDFSMECFTVDFLRIFSESIGAWASGGRLGARRRIQAFQEFSWNFLIS